jgi:hypothetical protein
MNINLPTPAAGTNALVQLISALRGAFSSVVSKDEAVPRILLSDIDGQIWQIAITTAGVVTTTTISGKDRGA